MSPDSGRGLVDGRLLGSLAGMGCNVGPQMRKKVCGMGTGLQESLNDQAEKLEGRHRGKCGAMCSLRRLPGGGAW